MDSDTVPPVIKRLNIDFNPGMNARLDRVIANCEHADLEEFFNEAVTLYVYAAENAANTGGSVKLHDGHDPDRIGIVNMPGLMRAAGKAVVQSNAQGAIVPAVKSKPARPPWLTVVAGDKGAPPPDDPK